MHTLEEVGREADTVRSEIEQLYVRGLASSTPADRKKLSELASEWDRLGAGHVASRLLTAVQKADLDAKDAPRALLSAYTSLHVFERVLSLEAAANAWTAHLESKEADEEGDDGDAPEETAAPATGGPGGNIPHSASDKPAQAPPIDDPKGALVLVEELARAVEDLVRTGLTSAGESTRQKLDASFKEASRRKLLRLGASLRYVNEEVGRFLRDDGSFSIRRFAFFLHRSWLLARGLEKGIRDKDNRVLAQLLLGGASPPRPIQWIEVVTLGVLKRTLSAACTFDFRLRVVASSDPDVVGKSLVLSFVFARKDDFAADVYLFLPQPQKFEPRVFNQGNVVRITGCALMLDERGGRVMLGPNSKVAEGAPFRDWQPLYGFDPATLLDRVKRASVAPLDLAVEMQEEVFVTPESLSDEPIRTSEGRRLFALQTQDGLTLDLIIADGVDGDELLPRLRNSLSGKTKPVLYGLCYYEFGRILFFPLSLMAAAEEPKAEKPKTEKAATEKAKGANPKGPKNPPAAPAKATGNGPVLLTLSTKKVDVQKLLKTLHL